MGQKAQILNHLKRKSITPIEALELYGCFRLAARISELREAGYQIETQAVGEKRIARYKLVRRAAA